MLVQNKSVMFTDLFKAARSKFEVITIFLAVLELIKIREVSVIQSVPFGDMEIIKNVESIKPAGGVSNG